MRIAAIVGSYHKGGMVNSAVDEILSAAAGEGAEVEKIALLEKHVEFCTNCQSCMQASGSARGICVIHDDMAGILDRVDASDAIVLASPMNFWTVTALMKRFIERLVCYGYWPWFNKGPRNRMKAGDKRAVVVVSCAAPGFVGRYFTNMVKLLKSVARLLGASQVDVLFIGFARHTPESTLADKHRARARKLGSRLAAAGDR